MQANQTSKEYVSQNHDQFDAPFVMTPSCNKYEKNRKETQIEGHQDA